MQEVINLIISIPQNVLKKNSYIKDNIGVNITAFGRKLTLF